jgi:hypothetical protein
MAISQEVKTPSQAQVEVGSRAFALNGRDGKANSSPVRHEGEMPKTTLDEFKSQKPVSRIRTGFAPECDGSNEAIRGRSRVLAAR